MTYSEFTSQIDRLKRQFGDKCYGDERSKLFWKKFAALDARSFELLVDCLLVTCKSPPMIDEFYEAMDSVKSRYSSTGGRCEKCDNSGWCDLWRDSVGGLVAERCSCCGGPDSLARSIETHSQNPDRDLAERIRQTFTAHGKHAMRLIPKSDFVSPPNSSVSQAGKEGHPGDMVSWPNY